MNIGVVIDERQPASGGSSTFQSRLVEALPTAPGNHRFFLLDHSEASPAAPLFGIPRIGLKPGYQQYRRYLDLRWWTGLAPIVLRRSLARLAGPLPALVRHRLQSPLELAVQRLRLDIVWFVALRAEVVSCPIVVTVWDLQHRLQPWFPEVNRSGWTWDMRERYYLGSLPRATRILTGTPAGKEEICRFYGVPPDNVVVIPLPGPECGAPANPEQLQLIRNKYRLTRDYFLYPAAFWPHKNHINLLKALAVTKTRDPAAPDVVLTGSDKGNAGYVRETANTLGLQSCVHELGVIPASELELLYQGAVALVFPTFFGPDNLPPLEAFANGCPVIASRVSGSEDQLGDAAMLVDPGNPIELADAMLTLFRDPALRLSLREKGYARSIGRTPSGYVQRLSALLDQLEPICRCWRSDYEHT